ECDGLSQFARCSPVCAYGYEVDSLRYLLCDTGTFQGEVRCVKQRCAGSAPWPFGTSGSLSSCTDGLHGQFCEVLCAAGYTRDSNLASYQCEAGQWMVPTTPPCIESSCFAAPVLENAQRLQACANRPAGYECNVTCLSGYQPVGSLRCVQGAYELSGLGCVASAVATRTAQVAAAQVVLVSVSEAEANTTRGRVERSARGLLGLDATVTPAQLATLVAEEVPSISPLDRALALAALQQLSPEAALRAALRTLLTAAIIPEVEAIFPVVEVALTRLDAHGVWANASEVLVQSSPLALAVFVEGERGGGSLTSSGSWYSLVPSRSTSPAQAAQPPHRRPERPVETETDGASLAAAVLGGAELERIQAAFRAKALEAIHVGDLKPGIELELISALDLQTITWSHVPVTWIFMAGDLAKLKRHLGLPFQDKGIDSLALNLSVAVQAKDYANRVPGNRLGTFYMLAQAKFSPLQPYVQHLIVATNRSTRLPEHWLRWTGAEQRTYTAEEIDAWRAAAAAQKREHGRAESQVVSNKMERWPHQKDCLEQCRAFIANQSEMAKKDFFVQMATGTGKSLVMADLLANLGPAGKACVIVPKLDLMEQMTVMLEDVLPSMCISRVGTGWRANLTADVFVCVRNSAWQLENFSFDLLLLDEAHHYEPSLHSDSTNLCGPHLRQVLSLKADKRLFFSATLLQNFPDFDFSLRPAIEAGVIQDYSIVVPVISEGDPRPSLVEIIQDLPLSRKILAFCNTVYEAKRFTKLLIAAGIPADHYNAETKQSRRQAILSSFALSEGGGGIRVLVTVDVLSEGVDLPWADTCLFVAPRRGIRFRQCIGRVLRRESRKLDALVIAPPIVVNLASGNLTEDQELRRLLQELASVDNVFRRYLAEKSTGQTLPLAIQAGGLPGATSEEMAVEQAAELLELRVLPSVLARFPTTWESWYDRLLHYKEEKGDILVPHAYKTPDGHSLGFWVSNQRAAKAKGKLAAERVALLDEQGFVWSVYNSRESWEGWYDRLRHYKEEYGDVLVPYAHKTPDGYSLGSWVSIQREAKAKGKLAAEHVALLDEQGFVWSVVSRESWEGWYDRLRHYKEETGDVLVPHAYKTPDGHSLGMWVRNQRAARAKGKLAAERVALLVEQGPSNLDQWLTATLQRLLGASLSATALQALAQDGSADAVDRTSLELQRVFSASLARSMTTAAALSATAL
ncbi:Probable helicase A859L, partial [Durusdinium trenchii]